MQTLAVDEKGFINYLIPWLLSERNIVTLPRIEKHLTDPHKRSNDINNLPI